MLLSVLSCVLLAQDLDVALRPGQSRGLTLLDQVEDSEERKAFQVLYREQDPLARRTRVTEFLKKFPASWLLAQVYEAGARASFGLTDYPTGLYYARESLKLYSENPLLTGRCPSAQSTRPTRCWAQLQHRQSDSLRILETPMPEAAFVSPAIVRNGITGVALAWPKCSVRLSLRQ